MAQMALSWILKDEDVTSGADRSVQTGADHSECGDCAEYEFTREELKKIDQISRGNL